MTGKGVGVAPYSVRLRITGFLARQHARDGDTERALIEYHSMLNVDDPSWPDNQDGDSMRIARDIEVAQMMTESGFYDHAIRVLQTTLILTRVNGDPQAAVVERQMLATAQLAQVKRFAVPTDLGYAEVDTKGAKPSAIDLPSKVAIEKDNSVVHTASELGTNDRDNQPETSSLSSLPDLPSQPQPGQYPVAVSTPVETKSTSRFRLSRLLPTWRRQSEAASEEAMMPAPTAPHTRPLTSPNVSPTYCHECATSHKKSLPQQGVAASASARATHDRTIVQSTSASPREPTNHAKPTDAGESATKHSTIVSKIPAKKRSDNSQEQSLGVAKSSRGAGSSLEPPAVAESLKPTTKQPAEPEQQLTLTQLENTSTSRHKIEEPLSESEMKDDGPSLQPAGVPGTADSNADVKESDSEPAIPNPQHQVGVAGQVPNPGIFALEGTSTTLAALLRRTGDASHGSAKHTRILRSVDLHRTTESTDPLKDFYLQRVEVVQATGNELDTPIYGQEVVIVDGSGQKPIYIAVMPHFILQIPANTNHPVTAEQIVDQLRVYWPNIRRQEIGVIRFEEWSRASKIARLKDAETSIEAAMQGGDVLYVDGLRLDRSQVVPAAEAIARLAGAKIRSQQPSVQQTGGSSK